jgi:hypothetical protein
MILVLWLSVIGTYYLVLLIVSSACERDSVKDEKNYYF